MSEMWFLLAIHRDLTDHLIWLALADWLEENGQVDRSPRARRNGMTTPEEWSAASLSQQLREFADSTIPS